MARWLHEQPLETGRADDDLHLRSLIGASSASDGDCLLAETAGGRPGSVGEPGGRLCESQPARAGFKTRRRPTGTRALGAPQQTPLAALCAWPPMARMSV